MTSVSPLVLALLDILAPCLPCTTPLLTEVSWIGGKCAFPFKAALYYSLGYCLNWTIPWSPSLYRALSKASLCPSGSQHPNRYSFSEFFEVFACLLTPESVTTSIVFTVGPPCGGIGFVLILGLSKVISWESNNSCTLCMKA